jgi:hypothetical protein
LLVCDAGSIPTSFMSEVNARLIALGVRTALLVGVRIPRSLRAVNGELRK